MHRLALGLIVGALLTAAPLAMAQDIGFDKDAYPLQTVNVGSLAYSVDPFYVVGCFWIKEVPGSREWDGKEVVAHDGTATVQCFHRDARGKMVPIDEFTTTTGGVLDHTDLGQAMYAGPQVAQP